MDVTPASATRYSTDGYLATYLHAEWSDLLFPTGDAHLPTDGVDSKVEEGGPGRFYSRLGEVTADWARGLTGRVAAVCDIGGSTGRMVFELARRFPGATERVMVEPSPRFCQWAERLLLGADFDGWLPVPFESGRPDYRRLERDRLPRRVERLSIYNTTAAAVPRPRGYFDVVTCLNVVDRVEDPWETTHAVGRLVRPGGLLVLASPHDYTPEFTTPSRWVADLRDLFDANEWAVSDRECAASYDFKHYERHCSHFVSQVVGAVKRA